MQIRSKLLVILSSILITSIPATAIAARGLSGGVFCSNFTDKANQQLAKISSLQTQITTRQSARITELQANWAKADESLASIRVASAKQRQAQFDKLTAKAKTQDQISAVNIYINSVNQAVLTRQSANDQARSTYRDSVKQLIVSRQSDINNQISSLKTSIDSAIISAQSSCASTTSDAGAIKTSFVSTITSLNTNFKATRQSNDLETQIKNLADIRNQAIKTNDQTFKDKINQATTELKKYIS